MNAFVQRALLTAYRGVRTSGVLDTKAGQALFEGSYDLYKSWLEATEIGALQPLVTPGSWVIDVGANIGFFSRRFGRWVSEGGRVLALEPEAKNARRLRARVGTSVEVIEALVADKGGESFLELNPDHPADHKLSVDGRGVPVKTVTLDGLWEEHGSPKVSLVKVDVQGAEPLVIAGAAKLLGKARPALFIEFDHPSLERMGSSVAELFDRIAAHGYAAHIAGGKAVSREEILARQSYADYLFLPKG